MVQELKLRGALLCIREVAAQLTRKFFFSFCSQGLPVPQVLDRYKATEVLQGEYSRMRYTRQ